MFCKIFLVLRSIINHGSKKESSQESNKKSCKEGEERKEIILENRPSTWGGFFVLADVVHSGGRKRWVTETISMNIAIQGVRLTLTEALEEYVNRRFATLERLVGKFESRQDLTLRVDIARSTRHHQKGDVFSVSVSLRIGRTTLRVEQTGNDVRQAIDDAQKRFKKIVEDHKDRVEKKDKAAIDKAKMKL